VDREPWYPGWRPVLADANSVSHLSQGGRSPISLLSAEDPAQESSACRTDGQREVIEGIVDSSELLHSGAELEQASHVADSAHKGRAASEAALESSSKTRQDTRTLRTSSRLTICNTSRMIHQTPIRARKPESTWILRTIMRMF